MKAKSLYKDGVVGARWNWYGLSAGERVEHKLKYGVDYETRRALRIHTIPLLFEMEA